jgi:hypothetical protein
MNRIDADQDEEDDDCDEPGWKKDGETDHPSVHLRLSRLSMVGFLPAVMENAPAIERGGVRVQVQVA